MIDGIVYIRWFEAKARFNHEEDSNEEEVKSM